MPTQLCWANNNGARGRHSPSWRRCCEVLEDIDCLPHHCVASFIKGSPTSWSSPLAYLAVSKLVVTQGILPLQLSSSLEDGRMDLCPSREPSSCHSSSKNQSSWQRWVGRSHGARMTESFGSSPPLVVVVTLGRPSYLQKRTIVVIKSCLLSFHRLALLGFSGQL
jgi:hypothetical protein